MSEISGIHKCDGCGETKQCWLVMNDENKELWLCGECDDGYTVGVEAEGD